EAAGPVSGRRLEREQVVAPAHLRDLAQGLPEVVRILEEAAAGEARDLRERFLPGAAHWLARALPGLPAGGEAGEVDGVDDGVRGREAAQGPRHLLPDLAVAGAGL